MKDKTSNNSKDIFTYSKAKAIYLLEDDFRIYKRTNFIPLTKDPSYLPYGILGLCSKGKITVNVYLNEYEISEGELLVILPNQLVSLTEKSDDFSMIFFILSQNLIREIIDGISRLSPLFFVHMRRKVHYKLDKHEINRFTEYYRLIYKMNPVDYLFKWEYITNILRLFYLDLYNNHKNGLFSKDSDVENPQEKLAYHFFLLVTEHYREYKEISFYASKLFITPKYLSSVIKKISGRSAKEWLVEYSIMEIKSLLRNSTLNIQEITVQTNFSNQASLSRFFRKQTGMSPSEFRTKKYCK